MAKSILYPPHYDPYHKKLYFWNGLRHQEIKIMAESEPTQPEPTVPTEPIEPSEPSDGSRALTKQEFYAAFQL